jgi:prefoldin alpha subunit
MEKVPLEERQRLQRILAELEEYQNTAELLRQQLSIWASSISELSMTVETVKTIKGLKPDTEILVPIGSDSFATTRIALTDRVITGLGANISAERSIEDAVKMLEARISEFEEHMEQVKNELEKLGERIEALRPEAERILKKTEEE